MWQKFFNVSFLIDTSGLLSISVASLFDLMSCVGPLLALKGLYGDLKHSESLFQRTGNTVFIKHPLCSKARNHFLLCSILFHLFYHPKAMCHTLT